MNTKIYIPAAETWAFYKANEKRCSEELITIAENTDTQYAVYLTEEHGYPLFFVCKGSGDPEYEEGAIGEVDCVDTAKRLYLKYLFPVEVSTKKKSEPEDNKVLSLYADDAVYEREDELIMAMCDFMKVAMQVAGDSSAVLKYYSESTVVDILDSVLNYMNDAHDLGCEIYRPTIIEVDGVEFFTEFPYDNDVKPEVLETLEEDEKAIIRGGLK